eukprot:scaffold5714_cov71-Phaeocystis_antarctica.AAC.4
MCPTALRSVRRCRRARGDCCCRGVHVRSAEGSQARLRLRTSLEIRQPHQRGHLDALELDAHAHGAATPAIAERAPRRRGQRQRARLAHAQVELLLDLPLQLRQCQAAPANELAGAQPFGKRHPHSERRGSQLRSVDRALRSRSHRSRCSFQVGFSAFNRHCHCDTQRRTLQPQSHLCHLALVRLKRSQCSKAHQCEPSTPPRKSGICAAPKATPAATLTHARWLRHQRWPHREMPAGSPSLDSARVPPPRRRVRGHRAAHLSQRPCRGGVGECVHAVCSFRVLAALALLVTLAYRPLGRPAPQAALAHAWRGMNRA